MATIIISMTGPTGQDFYVYPDGQSLDDWDTYKVAMTEGTGVNAGRYYTSVDSAQSNTNRFLAFNGASAPASYNDWVWAWESGSGESTGGGSGGSPDFIPLYSLPYIHIIGS